MIKYEQFEGSCVGELVGEGLDYEGRLRDDKIGAEIALQKLNAWLEKLPRTILSYNTGFKENDGITIFWIGVLYKEE